MKLRKYRIVLIIFVIIFILLFSAYLSVENFRKFIDERVIKKEVSENNSRTVFLLSGNSSNVIASTDNVYSVQSGQLKAYDKSATEKNTERVSVSTPLFDSNEKYVAISEKQSTTFYLLEERKS